jgi:SnoaL-like protein
MPSRQSLDAFIAQVVGGDHVGAIRDWYCDDAWMQENLGERRTGRGALMANEAATLAKVERVETQLLDPPMVDGERVALHWRFTFHPPGRPPMTLEEIAWQTWRGEKVAEETFFYDPGQMGR